MWYLSGTVLPSVSFRGNRWVSLVDEKIPPGKPEIALYFSSKTTKKGTYARCHFLSESETLRHIIF